MEIIYKDFGVTFVYLGHANLGSIQSVHLKSPFKGITSDGLIELNKSTMADVVNNYGKPIYFEAGYAYYYGIAFSVDCKCTLKKAVKLKSKITEILIYKD